MVCAGGLGAWVVSGVGVFRRGGFLAWDFRGVRGQVCGSCFPFEASMRVPICLSVCLVRSRVEQCGVLRGTCI